MEPELDRRVTPARDDLAAAHLKGRVPAPRYAEGVAMRVRAASTGLWRAPRSDRGLDTELLHGEVFTVYDEREGWAWGQSQVDDYVGYVASDALTRDDGRAPTHKIAVPRTLVFPEPDIKGAPVMALSREARVTVTEVCETFLRLSEGGFIPARHVALVCEHAPSAVAVARELVGAPYLWGGRTSAGLDCSGLLQIAFAAAGVRLPRDSDQQEKFGEAIDPVRAAAGDLVFWDGHAGVMVDAARLLHANAFHMAVAIEPLSEAIERIAPIAGPVTSLRRVSAPS